MGEQPKASGAVPGDVQLRAAGVADSLLLANLLELYIHDLSPAFPNIEIGADGRFGYPRLPLYWSEPEGRFAFLTLVGGRVAGFALATCASPVAAAQAELDVAEFFVLKRYRRTGVGRRAAFLLWEALPGAWTVRVAESNPGAYAFWSGVVAEFSRGTAIETTRAAEPTPWRVFHFENRR